MKWLSLVAIILSLIGFSSCGGARTTYKKKSTSNLLTTKGAAAVTAPAGMVGTYESWDQSNYFDNIKVLASGEVVLVKGDKVTTEKLGRDSAGNYYITNTLVNTVYKITYSQDYNLTIHFDNDNLTDASANDIYYKIPN